MSRIIATLVLMIAGLALQAQEQKEHGKLYNPDADAKADIRKAVAQAKSAHKNVLLQIGGNWCIWCTRFHHAVAGNDTLKQLQDRNFVVVYVNYEKKNAGDPIWKELGYPQRFGFPVFVILDENGSRIHTQNSAYLEEGKGHSREKIAEFFTQWGPDAVSGKTLRH